MIQSKKLVLILLLSVIVHVELSQDVMKKLSIQFSKPLEACKKEMELSDSVTKEFANFWKEGYVLKEPHTGCAILCMSSKLDLLDGEYQMHHGNAHEFAKKHGADDAMAKQLVDIIHNCGQTTALDNDPCITTLNVAQCFKNKIHDLKWAPDPDVIMAEILAEV